MRLLLLALLPVFLLPTTAGETVPADFDAYLNQALKDWNVPGAAVAIVSGDQVVMTRGYGVREVGVEGAVDEDTIFAVGSTTKAFTATALAMLVDQKKLAWDDRVTERLPGFQLFDPAATHQLTVRDLLTHRTGLPRGDFLWYGSELSRDKVLHQVRHLQPQWGFRERFGYQNIMFLAAGQIIPGIEGFGWDGYLRDKIFQPLGMDRATTSTLALRGMKNVATPHADIDGKLVTLPWRNLDNMAPAGSINAGAKDMAQWLRFNLNNGSFDGKRLLSAKTHQELMTPQTVVRLEGRYTYFFADARYAAYGLGWFLNDYHGALVVSHGGAIDGMRAQVTLLPEKKLGVVVLTNLNQTLLPIAVQNRLLDSWLNRKPKDWSRHFLDLFTKLLNAQKDNDRKRAAERRTDTNPSLGLDAYTGDFVHKVYPKARIQNKEGGLYLAFTDALSGKLTHWQHDTFRITWDLPHMGTGFATFQLDGRGQVSELVLEDIGDFKRQ